MYHDVAPSTAMPRWVMVVVVLLCPLAARADDLTVHQTAITLTDVPGTWTPGPFNYGAEELEPLQFRIDGTVFAILRFSPGLDQTSCPEGENLAPDFIDVTTMVNLPSDTMGDHYEACIVIGAKAYLVYLDVGPDADVGGESYAPVVEVIRRYAAALVVDHGAVTRQAVELRELYLAQSGLTVQLPAPWDVQAIVDEGDRLYVDDASVNVYYTDGVDCDRITATFREADDGNYRDLAAAPSGWSGLDYFSTATDGDDGYWTSIFCQDYRAGALVVGGDVDVARLVVDAVERAVHPPVVADGAVGSVTDEEPDDTSLAGPPTPEAPRERTLIGGLAPRTIHVAVVRRSDEMATGYGFGIQLGRMTWREARRLTLGYDLGAAAASGFWELQGQARAGVSPMAKDLPVDAYVAAGVDVIGGKHQPATDVAPVAGAGAEVLFTLPGLGAELGGQILADPGGLHSYTLRGGLLFGPEAKAKLRLGASYVRFADDSSVLWVTLGLTAFELD